MLGTDRDALLCDLAETYGVFSFDELPVMTLATLCAGLRDSSRIKHKMRGHTEIISEYTLVHIADSLSVLLGALADDKKTPELYYDLMVGKREQEVKRVGFDSIEDFKAARERIINGG